MLFRLFSFFFLITCLAASPGKSADPLDDIPADNNFKKNILDKLRETCSISEQAKRGGTYTPPGLMYGFDGKLKFLSGCCPDPSRSLESFLTKPEEPSKHKQWAVDETGLEAIKKHLFILKVLGKVLYNHWITNEEYDEDDERSLHKSIDLIGLKSDENGYSLTEAARKSVVNSFIKKAPLDDLPQLTYQILNHTSEYSSNDQWRVPEGLSQTDPSIDGQIKNASTFYFEKNAEPAHVIKAFLTPPTDGTKWEMDCSMAQCICFLIASMKQLDEPDMHNKTFNWYIKQNGGHISINAAMKLLFYRNENRKFISDFNRSYFIYIKNIEEYAKIFQSIKGAFSSGINLVGARYRGDGEPTYIGFDPKAFKDEPLTLTQIYDYLYYNLINDKIPESQDATGEKRALQEKLRADPKEEILERIRDLNRSHRMKAYSAAIPPEIIEKLRKDAESAEKQRTQTGNSQ